MSIMESKVVFIGAGNMAEAIVGGMVAAEFCAPEKIILTDLRPERLTSLAAEYGVSTSMDKHTVQDAEVVVLAVKPQGMDTALAEVAPLLKEETLVVSVAAGIKCATIEAALSGNPRVVRVMPNLPAMVGKGAAGIAAGTHADDADLEVVESMMNCVGMSVLVAEKELDAVTALSGTGPAYVYYLLEGILKAADAMGLDAGVSRLLMEQTVEGAVALMKDSGEAPAVLRERVTSKGGTTAAAIKSLRESDTQDAIVKALMAAKLRSEELSE